MITRKQVQIEFEATCFMYEMVDSALKTAVVNYNAGFKLTTVQKYILAKAIWRN